MTIFPKVTIKKSYKMKRKKRFIFAIYFVSYMIFNVFFTKL